MVFTQDKEIGGQQEYPAGESIYNFSLTLPDQNPPSELEKLGPLKNLVGNRQSNMNWSIEAWLEVSAFKSIEEIADITVA